VSIISAGGKGPIDRLIRIFDGDKNSSSSETKFKTLELLEIMNDPVSDISTIKTKVADKFSVLETTLEDMMQEEVPEYTRMTEMAAREIGPVGKPLVQRFIALRLANRVQQGESATDVIPTTIQSIVSSISGLKECGNYLRS